MLSTPFLLALAITAPCLQSAASAGFILGRSEHIIKRYTLLRGQYATEEIGSNYLLNNNLWGMGTATGSQSSQPTDLTGDVAAWETSYSWSGSTLSVRSYANVELLNGLGKSLASISSIPTKWNWSYENASSKLVADVSYDLWLSTNSTCGHAVTTCSAYEVMVWLSARGGATPAGKNTKTVTLGGASYTLWIGTIKTWSIFTFVAVNETTAFDADLKEFFNYLTDDEGVSTAQYLTGVQAGTEPFNGSATLTTSAYSASVVLV